MHSFSLLFDLANGCKRILPKPFHDIHGELNVRNVATQTLGLMYECVRFTQKKKIDRLMPLPLDDIVQAYVLYMNEAEDNSDERDL